MWAVTVARRKSSGESGAAAQAAAPAPGVRCSELAVPAGPVLEGIAETFPTVCTWSFHRIPCDESLNLYKNNTWLLGGSLLIFKL